VTATLIIAGILFFVFAGMVTLPLWKSGRNLVASLTIFVMAALAGTFYVALGTPGARQPRQEQDAVGPMSSAGSPDVEAMVTNLAARMKDDPENLQGWVMLGRSYFVLGRYDQALEAYSNAMRLGGDGDPDVLASYAEVLVLEDPDALDIEGRPLFERVLEMDPGNAKGLWYGGIAAENADEYPLAVERFQALLALQPPDDFQTVIKERLLQLRATMGVPQ